MVEHCVRDAGVAGSNPVSPTLRICRSGVAAARPRRCFAAHRLGHVLRGGMGPRVTSTAHRRMWTPLFALALSLLPVPDRLGSNSGYATAAEPAAIESAGKLRPRPLAAAPTDDLAAEVPAPNPENGNATIEALRSEFELLRTTAPAWVSASDARIEHQLDRLAGRLDEMAARSNNPLPQAHEPVLLITVALISLGAGFAMGRVTQRLRKSELRPHL